MYEKRIKRQILGREFLVFIECAGFQRDLLRAELVDFGLQVVEGVQESFQDQGLWVRTGLRIVYRLNLHLFFARRIWIAVEEVKAGAVEELFKRCQQIPWELWIPGPGVACEARLFNSAIHHQGKAEKTLEKAISRYFETIPPDHFRDGVGNPEDGMNTSGNREDKNRVLFFQSGTRGTVLVDSTGRNLGKRGYRIAPGPAPIAEHLGAWLIRELELRVGRPGSLVVDGMTGSGTLLFEAYLRLMGLAPGAAREFAFQFWPSFQPASWEYSRRQAIQFRESSELSFLGIDISHESGAAWKMNVQRLSELWQVGTEGQGPRLVEGDFFNWQPPALPAQASGVSGWLLLNPPYDMRLGEDVPGLFRRIVRRLSEVYSGWGVLLVVPSQRLEEIIPSRWVMGKPGIFNHGGKKVRAFWLEVR